MYIESTWDIARVRAGINNHSTNGGSSRRPNKKLKVPKPKRARRVANRSSNTKPRLAVPDFPFTDAGNAEKFAAMFGNRVRWDKRRKRWLIWNAHRWHEDISGEVERLAVECVRSRQRDAVEIEDDDRRARAIRWCLESESLYRRKALLESVSNFEPVVDVGDKWDTDEMLLGCQNGVVELHSGSLRDGQPDDRITLASRIAFDPTSECPRWMQFLEEVFGNEELIQFVQRAVGYSLSGSTTEQVLFMCYGTGANGKSVFLDTLRYVMGDYASNTPFSTFEQRDRDGATNDLAALVGKRLVTSSETREFTQLNEARIKAITGGDPVTARFLYQEFFTFYPRFKVWLATNHKPKVSDDSYGFWRRIRLIPFTKTFGPEKADPNLGKILRSEAQGILTWAVLGALAWQSQGLKSPALVADATAQYREESDPLAGFLNDRCVVNENAKAPATALLEAYNSWAKHSGEIEMTQTMFGRRMNMRGFEKILAS